VINERSVKMVKITLKQRLFSNDSISMDDIENNYTLDEKYEKEFEIKGKTELELKQLITLINKFINKSLRIPAFESFHFGYKIPQINCGDFDFLKINKTNVVNIEFKDISLVGTGDFERIKNKLLDQLKIRNNLLSVFNREVISIGFIFNKDDLFFYRLEENQLHEISTTDILLFLACSGTDFSISMLSDVLNRESLNISPINSGSTSVEKLYDLTDQQQAAVNMIVKLDSRYYIVKGGAGTGKSLVAFELANIFSKQEKKTILFFLAKESKLYGQYDKKRFKVLTLSPNGDDIPSRFEKVYQEDFNVLIIDEAQRLTTKQIDRIKRLIEEKDDRHCIFVFDYEQNMVSDEEGRIIKQYLEDFVDSKYISKLNLPLRFDENTRFFIRKLFGMRNTGKGDAKEANVEIVKIFNVNEANEFSNYLSENYGFVKLKPLSLQTPLKGYKSDYDAYNVIGKDFENIIVAFNDGYYLDEHSGIQRTENNTYEGDHNLEKCYYELFTRVKNKIIILVINNNQLYNDLIKLKNSFY
jgi:primosomal protein N' (replication factor Y)